MFVRFIVLWTWKIQVHRTCIEVYDVSNWASVLSQNPFFDKAIVWVIWLVLYVMCFCYFSIVSKIGLVYYLIVQGEVVLGCILCLHMLWGMVLSSSSCHFTLRGSEVCVYVSKIQRIILCCVSVHFVSFCVLCFSFVLFCFWPFWFSENYFGVF